MAKENNQETKEIILKAAQQEFVIHGFNGARMRAIAERANINKGLLHYYFGSKEGLFEEVFTYVFSKSMAELNEVMQPQHDIFESISRYVELHMSKLMQNPFIPIYILQETNRDPERLVKLMRQNCGHSLFDHIEMRIQTDIDAGKIRAVNARQFVVSLLSMVVFPFLERPLLQTLMGTDQDAYDEFLQERKAFIPAFVKAALQLNPKEPSEQRPNSSIS